MQSVQFIKHIRNPHNILKEDLLELNNLCQEYPYCASLHKLRLKALKQAEKNQFGYLRPIPTTKQSESLERP